MSPSQSNDEELSLNRLPSPHTKQEHVNHLIAEHGITPPQGANSHRLRLLHGAAHQDLMGDQAEHLHKGHIAIVRVDEEGNLQFTRPIPRHDTPPRPPRGAEELKS